MLAAAMLQKIRKRFPAPAASLRRPRQVIIGIEPRVGFPAFGGSMEQVMQERLHARRGDVGIALVVKRGVEKLLAQPELPE